jgi:diguanylate cyclase (GGDEF)-like protein/PAS domain S-box-containing protein
MTNQVTDGPVVEGPVTRILLVEDDEDDYVLTRDLLADIPGETYALDWVTTVAAGLATVGERRHDAYLIDYRLGAESGLDLLRALQREGCRSPIILLTGQGDAGVDVAAMQAGAADYLVKGEVTAAELGRALRYACAQEQHLAQRDQALAATEVALDHLRVSEQFALATLDALPEHIAILDDAGVILAVNAAWRRFAVANGAREDAVGIGQNYASVCAAAAATGEEQGGQAARGITDVLRGRAASFALEYPCHSPTERRWFTMEAAPFVGEGPGRVVVAHHTITARILAQQELERREESFRLLFRANPQPLWVYDVATLRFLEVNDAAVDHYGYTRDEFLALRISDIRAPEDVDALVTMVGRRPGALHDAGVWRHHTKDGRIIDVAITAHTLTFAGRAAGLVLAQDITLRKRAEEEVRRSEARYRTIVETAQEGIWQLDADDRTTFVNQRMADMLGYTAAEMLGQPLSAFAAEGDQAAVQARLERRRQGEVEQEDVAYRRKDGAVLWACLAANPLRGVDGQYAGALAMVADITARKQAEAALVQERDLLQTLMDTAPDSIYFKDAAARFVRVNRAQARLLGAATPDAVVGRRDVDYFPPDLARATYADDLQVLDSGQALVNRLEDQSARGHGPRWILSTKMPIVRDGQITGLVGISRDITDLRAAEDALRASEERFRALSEHANDLVAILDRAGVFRYVSPSFERLLGYAPATMEGHNAFAFAHPDDAPALAPGFAAFVTAPGATMRTEGRARHVDGSWRVMEMVFHNRLDDPVIRGIIVNSHDVTARVQMQRDLEEGQQRYRSLFAHHPDAVFALGRDGALTSANAACAALSGYTVDELLTLAFSALIAPEDLERGDLHVARALAGAPQHDVAVRLRRKDGNDRVVSVTAIPIVVDGAVVGVYGIAKDMTAHNAAQQALRRQARYDSLTDLPNRALLHEHIAAALVAAPDASRPLALLLIDLDRFKEINDAFGHERGDALLRQAADRLRGVVRAGDTVARLSGDEFAVLLPGADATGAARVADAIRAALDAPLPVDEHLLRVGASVGIVLAPAHGRDGATLLRRADMAMDAAKRGRLGQALYEPAQDQHSPERLALSGALRDAIEQGALVLHYQPQVDLASGHVCGVEALVRWPHPERGLIPPDAFIPLAEQTGLIAPLTEWVLAEAIRQAREWQRAGLLLGVSVNLSMWNLHDPALPDRVAALLHAHGLAPAWLRLELTESALMADTDRTMDVLARLAALGVHLAVDDFGSGYSSLSYLKRLPVDELKIDKGFVREMATDETDRAIVASTVGMGHALGLRVVAEGIEDRATWELLAGMGCDMAQGYYVARPLPPDALVRWLREAPWAVA